MLNYVVHTINIREINGSHTATTANSYYLDSTSGILDNVLFIYVNLFEFSPQVCPIITLIP